MKLRNGMLTAAAVLCGAASAWAGAREDAQSALAKLAEADSYSWSTTTESAMGGGQSVEGKRQKDGVTQLNMTMRDEPVEVFMRGERVVVKTDDGWKTADELMQNAEPGQPNPGAMIARMARGYRSPVLQATEVLSKASDVSEVDGAYVGELTGEAAAPFMQMRGGRRGGQDGRPPREGGPGAGPQGGPGGPPADRPAAPEIKDAKVVVKVWAKDGVATKIEYRTSGKVTGRDGEERDVSRNSATDVKDVGTAGIDVPDEVAAKLGE